MKAAPVSFALVVTLFAASAARADVLAPGSKGVKNSLAIEGKVPPNKMLVIGNTFFGATRTKPGASVDVSWHPLSGSMRLYLVDASEGAKIPEAGSVDRRDELKTLAEKGISCSDEFKGTRTISETEAADEVRLAFHVDATATSCTSKLVRTEYYAKDGKAVAAPDGKEAPKPSAEPSAATTSQPAPADAPPPPAAETARSGCAACALGSNEDRGFAPSLVLACAALISLMRKKRRR